MLRNIIMLLFAVAFFMQCTTSREVSRIDANSQVDLSGRWNDTDSRLVSEEMISDALSRIWLSNFVEANQKKPVIIVGLIKNKTHEIISTDTFIKDMEREFINSGKATIVQAGDEREKLRDERADQQEYASAETVKRWRQEKGADFMLQGTVNSIVDGSGDDKVIFYQVDLELNDLETNEKVWLGTKKIKKLVRN
jgi:penicillin-binding protein activator